MKKRIFSRVLALFMALTLLSTTAFAAVLTSDSIDENGYLLPGEDNYNYALEDDFELSQTLRIGSDVTASLDLNGHTLSLAEGTEGSVIWVGSTKTGNSGATLNLTDSGSTGKITGAQTGGGIQVVNGSTLNMTGGEISGNVATKYDGGGIRAAGGSTVNLTDVTITDNRAEAGNGPKDGKGNGGGIYVVKSDLTLNNTTVSGNTAEGNGGGVNLNNTASSLTLKGNTVISDNHASGDANDLHIPRDVSVATDGYSAPVREGFTFVWRDAEGNAQGFNESSDERNLTAGWESNSTLPPITGDSAISVVTPDAFTGTTGADAGTTAIEDEEVPLAGLVTLAELLEALREYEGIEDAELPEDFQWVDHEYAQAIYWGLDEALVEDAEDNPLDPDEIVTVALLREVLENFVDYKGVGLTIAVEGEDDMIVMDLGERLVVFYGELEASLEGKAA